LYLSEIHRRRRPVISFELFPPKTAEAETRLFNQVVPELLALDPSFVTCTYGAGGSTRDKTLEVVSRIKREFGREVAAHLTCVDSSRADLGRYLDHVQEQGIRNLVALRGDPPAGDSTFHPHPDGLMYAVELVRLISARGGFEVAVAGYPEGHPEAPDKHTDWQHCREKVEAGAAVVMTQLFYDTRFFFEFEDYLRNRLGVTVPIIPGILPILNSAQVRRFCALCKAQIPPDVASRLEKYIEDNESCRRYGVELATRMCTELLDHGVPGLHFYILNRAESTREVFRNLGLPKGLELS